MRRIAFIACLIAALPAGLLTAGAGADDTRTYRIEMLNAFGIFKGSDVRVAGVRTGIVTDVDINPAKRAEVTIELTGPLATLGDRTTCATEPQSLIAEFFIDCTPKGDPMPDGTLISHDRVTQSVQSDLLFNTFREDYRERLRVIVNELGTAMAANSENLNDAIRLSVPALTDFREVTKILAGQRHELDRLNVNAERVISRLAARRDDVVRATVEGRDAAEAAASRSGDLTTDVGALDDFLTELRPTLVELGETAREGTPLLASLRTAAPGLDELSGRLPGFNSASERAVVALGRASVPGRRALAHGRDEISDLARAGLNAPLASEVLGDFTADLDDPRRVVEEDERAARNCDDPTLACWGTGRRGPTGYTGLEALLNYVYYQSGAINQFDSLGHLLAFNAFDVGGGPCGGFNAMPDVPAAGGGRTTDLLEADPCVSWTGDTQPDINLDLNLPRYDNSVCPDGSADPSLCDPAISTHDSGGYVDEGDERTLTSTGNSRAPAGEQPAGEFSEDAPPAPGQPPVPAVPALPLPGGESGDDPVGGLQDLLGLPDALPGGLGGDRAKRPGKGGNGGGAGGSTTQAAEELLDFLYGP